VKQNRQSITEFKTEGKSSRMIWDVKKGGICQIANEEKKLIRDTISAQVR